MIDDVVGQVAHHPGPVDFQFCILLSRLKSSWMHFAYYSTTGYSTTLKVDIIHISITSFMLGTTIKLKSKV